MAPYSSSTHTSSSSSTDHSSLLISSDSLSQKPSPGHSDTLRPTKSPRTPRPGLTITQPYHNQSHDSHISEGTGSSSNLNTPHTASIGGLRAQLHHLLPRHALFHVRINIHQLDCVPLVKGEFGVRWKFKKVRSRKENGRNKHDKGKGKADESQVDTDDEDEHDHVDADQTSIEGSTDDAHNSHGYRGVPSVVVSDGYPSTSNSAPSTRPASPNPYAQYLTSDWLPQSYLAHSNIQLTRPDSPSISLSSTTPQGGYAHARGMTTFLKLQDHSVVWEHTLNVVVRMDVDRDTADLLSNELKLVVMQRVIQGDIDAPQNPRLGAVYLNLAEYANVGPITRRYLLCESKTNATIKLTTQLEHIGGEKTYKAPPLPKGEIFGGIAGILEKDIYRIRPRALDLYGMYHDDDEKRRKDSSFKNGTGPFDISKLSSAFGPRTTETLIEAIFNPVPTHSEKESPFTYFVPLKDPEKKPSSVTLDFDVSVDGSGSLNGNGSLHSTATSSEYTSLYSNSPTGKAPSLSSQSGHSLSSHEHGSEFGAGGGEGKHKSWWRKITHSRPGTPVI